MIRLNKLLLLIPLALIALISSPVYAQEEGPIYIVEEGDTLTAIAFKFGTTVEELASINDITNPSSIYPGQQLVIPGYPGVTGVLRTIDLPLGQSLDALADEYQTTVDSIVKLNRVVNPERMYVDQELIIPQPLTDDEQGTSSFSILSDEESTWLEYSAVLGQNPWTIRGGNTAIDRYWLVPGTSLQVSVLSEFQKVIETARIIPTTAIQGHLLELILKLSEPGRITATLDGAELKFLPSNNLEYVALQGIHALAEPGLVDLALEIYTNSDEVAEYSMIQPIRILEGGYGMETLSVPAQTIDPEITGPEDDQIETVISQVSQDRLWEGPFQYPSEYYESFPSYFGTRRSYNGSSYSYYHTGLDFYGGTSTPILAPARGRVVFTDELIVRGNTTYIDHGWGVITGYLHQSEILVEEGELVEPGQIIGYVGGTGRVTGPHLHWEIWVGGIPVDPLVWMENIYP